MSNIGTGETYKAYYVEPTLVTKIDTLLSDSAPIESLVSVGMVRTFKYRYLTSNEMLSQPLSSWVKAQYENVIYTSETNIDFKNKAVIFTEDGKRHILDNKIPQRQQGMFLVSKKYPHILELR